MTPNKKNMLSGLFAGDKVLWLCIGLLLILSLLLSYSFSVNYSLQNPDFNQASYWGNKIMTVILCFVLIWVFHKLDYRVFLRASFILMLLAAVFMIVALITNNNSDSTRWISFSTFRFRPVDLALTSIILYTAFIIGKYHGNIKERKKKMLLWSLIVTPVLILVILNNITYPMLVILVCMFMFSCAGNKLNVIFKRVLLPLVAILILTAAFSNTDRLKLWTGRIVEYVKNPEVADNREDIPEISEIALGRGGVFGVGPGNSIHSEYRNAQYGEFSYAILLEEYGILGGLVVLMLYMLILWRIVKLALRTDNISQSVLIAGFGLLILLMAFTNMLVCVGLFPITGISLPLLSVDLSSMLFSSYAFGIILSVSNYMNITDLKNKKMRKSEEDLEGIFME